jgi:hypothetical protein
MGRIENEKKTVSLMIKLYCRHYEKNKNICNNCTELLRYAEIRLDRCKFGENKPTCKKCPIHCYKSDMREHMRKVMRWAGPRMILYHPFEALKHLIREIF